MFEQARVQPGSSNQTISGIAIQLMVLQNLVSSKKVIYVNSLCMRTVGHTITIDKMTK